VSDHLETVLGALTTERLDEPAPQRFPIDDETVLGEIAFLVQHDSYHIGQVALLRRQLGLPAMRYR